jgi:predicted aspartyl protease
MRINGKWLLCDDGVVRPVVRGRVQDSTGEFVMAEFLLDIGADRTVLTADVLEKLGLPLLEAEEGLSGLGGGTDSVVIETRLLLTRDNGNPVVFNSHWAAVTEPAALDLCILGRDITDLFAVIIDRPQQVVCLLRDRHRYTIIQG